MCLLVVFFVFFSVIAKKAIAEDLSSANFVIRDSVFDAGGGNPASTNFQLLNALGQAIQGEDTSASFIHRQGALYFPDATSPILSAASGDGKVNLSWTASTANLGNVTNYRVGTATVSGGPYTFEEVGNALLFAKTGLTNGTPYFFRIQVQLGEETLAQSSEVSATPAGQAAPAPAGGGGSAGYIAPITGVIFSGRAYPLSKVVILKDGQIAISTIAGPDARFEVFVTGLATGNYNLAVYGEDSKGARSSIFTFPLYITSGVTTNVGGIFIAPTIAIDKSEVKRGDDIVIFGQSAPKAEVTIAVNSEENFFVKTIADKDGAYLHNFDTVQLAIGQHLTKSKAALDGEVSSFGKAVGFVVGAKNVFTQPTQLPLKGDFSNEGRVNLVDFSIAAYWYKRPSPPAFVDLNGDRRVDLIDFSIMAFYWTG